MDGTASLSKGCFVFKNGVALKKGRKSCKATSTPLHIQTFRSLWQSIEEDIARLKNETYGQTLDELSQFVMAEGNVKENPNDIYHDENFLSTAVLLTGINQPDHTNQFVALEDRLKQNTGLAMQVCVLQSHECSTLKSAVESMVFALVSEDRRADDEEDVKRIRRSQYTMKLLENWWHKQSNKRTGKAGAGKGALVVILPDFERFQPTVLQDFILVLCAHRESLPLVLVLGVATTIAAVHTMLPYQVTAKIKLCVFEAQPAPVHMNKIIETILLSPKYPLYLSGKVLHFLMSVFLYYDFSINGFLQAYKYCLFEHFYNGGNAYALCSYSSQIPQVINGLGHDDLESMRRLMSIRPFVENLTDGRRVIKILSDDAHFKTELPPLLEACQLRFLIFRCLMEFLYFLVWDLPKSPLGKYRREIYVHCTSSDVAQLKEFNECWQIISIMSKQELVAKIQKAKLTTEDYVNTEVKDLPLFKDCRDAVYEALTPLDEYLNKLENACQTNQTIAKHLNAEVKLQSRKELKDHLSRLCKESKPTSEFLFVVQETLAFIKTEIVEKFLRPMQDPPALYELFVYKDLASLRQHTMGSPRAALHVALNNPQVYLQCKCCELRDSTQILNTLPDLSIVYKLHLECGRMINLFDWLQSFRAIVDPNDDEEQTQISPEVQARFARCVAELQFLGYIKMSKRKTDHAMRLTW